MYPNKAQPDKQYIHLFQSLTVSTDGKQMAKRGEWTTKMLNEGLESFKIDTEAFPCIC